VAGPHAREWSGTNEITFNAVICACAKAGDGKRAGEWLQKMKLAEVLPNSFSYNQAAKPYVSQGDYRRVENLMTALRNDGLPPDDFCLASLLYAYGNAHPKQKQRAETAFRRYVADGVSLSRNAIAALARVVGRSNADALCEQCGVDAKGIEGGSSAKSGGLGNRMKGVRQQW